jgi:hypothetical protein
MTGVQTINGAIYPPPGTGSASITQAGALVACLGTGAITISSIGVGDDVEIYNAGTLRFDTVGSRAIENLSTVNGSAYPPNFVIPQDITVSTLTANSISTLGLEGVSSINGSAYPPFYSTIGDIASGGFVYTNTSNVAMGVSATAFAIDSSNNLIVGSATADTAIVFASTIQASSNGLNIFELSAGANVKLDTGGKVYFNEGLSTITDGVGLVVGPEGATLTFPLDTTGSFNVGELVNVSTINGNPYPAAPAAKQATYYKSAGQNMTSGANDVTFDLSGAWNNADGYITHTDGTTDFEVVQAGLYQLEFNAAIVANGATWGTGSNKTINIDITRSPTAETAIISSGCLTSSASNYSQCVSATYALEAGDVINLRVFNTFATAVPDIQGSSGFDLNTFFTWRFIS